MLWSENEDEENKCGKNMCGIMKKCLETYRFSPSDHFASARPISCERSQPALQTTRDYCERSLHFCERSQTAIQNQVFGERSLATLRALATCSVRKVECSASARSQPCERSQSTGRLRVQYLKVSTYFRLRYLGFRTPV